MSLTDKQIKEIKKVFKKYHVVFGYLFGSQAKGTAIKSSDFDFAVMMEEEDIKKRFKFRCKMISDIENILKNDAEVVVLNDTNDILLKFVIIKEGLSVYEKNHLKRVLFELKVSNDYYDFKPFIDAYNKAYLKRELIKEKIYD